MASKQIVITDLGGTQRYSSDFTFAETITLLELWKQKLIQEKIAPKKEKSNKKNRA